MTRFPPRVWPAVLLFLTISVGIETSARAGFNVVDLGLISSGGSSGARGINASGQVAGVATNSLGASTAVRGGAGGGFQGVPSPQGALTSVATSINRSGDVGGSFTDQTGVRRGFYTSSGASITLDPIVMGTQQGRSTQVSGINAGGQVVGTVDFPGGASRAFLGSGGSSAAVINPLGTGGFNSAAGINDSGVVVGTSETSPNGIQHAFITGSTGQATDLFTRNGAGNFNLNVYGTAIASNGDVVGSGDVGRFQHAFFASKSGGSLVDLGLLAGASSSFALGVNDNARVVGMLDYGSSGLGQPGGRAFLWDSVRGMFDLNALIGPADQSDWLLTRATGINSSDQVCGEGYLNGELHGFLLTPIVGQSLFDPPSVPEPPALVLSTLGLGIAAAWRKRNQHRALRRGRTGDQACA